MSDLASRIQELRAAMAARNSHVADWREKIHDFQRQRNASSRSGGASCGYYAGNTVHVAPALCAVPGRGYSWPGAACDRTPFAVYAHELGHHVSRVLRPDVVAMRRAGPRITGYEPNAEESFAETFRLFVTNPTLLLAGRPGRFELMSKFLRHPFALGVSVWSALDPGYQPRHADMIERWIRRGA